jgi:hypothetical protein
MTTLFAIMRMACTPSGSNTSAGPVALTEAELDQVAGGTQYFAGVAGQDDLAAVAPTPAPPRPSAHFCPSGHAGELSQ